MTESPASAICLPKSAAILPIEFAGLPANPLVSIVVPSFNQGAFIRATIDSILAQDYRPLQIIIMDGASTDNTVDVLKSYGSMPELAWVSEKDSGVVEAVNKGFAKAQGQIIAIQSSDDCYLPGTVRHIVNEFLADDKLGLLYGDTVKVDADGKELARTPIGPYSLLNLLRIRTWIPQPSAFFRSELLQVLGGWDDRIPYAPDTDLWVRMAFRTRVKKLDRYLSQRRVHGEQRDKQAARIARDFSRMIEQSADIAGASTEIQRAAHAGKHLMRARYNASGSDWVLAWNLLRAGIQDQECLDVRGIATHLFWIPLRRQLSRVKRTLRSFTGAQ